ncbi:calpain-13-like isoform X2 [Rhinatrema bivittatum]|uniref:calpain-13-like isoform X2 n=1 Tax=Rhinatrema bivittatum TaxID=194408 RepID=UPI00112EFA0C|nr:calpain-13-like isoform X2 [Rhinatrema bivittatum]
MLTGGGCCLPRRQQSVMMPIPGVFQNIFQGRKMQGKFGSLENPRKFKDQDFDYLREYCQRQRILFEDETFPAHISSIGPSLLSEDKLRSLKWKRPSEIHRDPQLLVEGASRFDIVQGDIGDCWVLAALGALTTQRRFLENVLPGNQGFTQSYSGIFHFRFWQFGEWVDVVVDDRLPFLNGKYLSVQPRSCNEFWPSLLEKAYAKLRGSYQNLHWGFMSEALVDFTGGVQMQFGLKNPSPFLQDIILAAIRSKSLMGCSTLKGQEFSNVEMENGLVKGHAYTVTGTEQVPYKNGWINLIRVWNPWGKGEWNGPWSDKSGEWKYVDSDLRRKINVLREDGEFWISCKDFLQQFAQINICNLTPTFLDFEKQQKPWSGFLYINPWLKGSIGEGSCIFDTFFKNPQCLVTVKGSDLPSNGHNVVVTLMQKPSGHSMSNKDRLPIGLMLYKVDSEFQSLKGTLPQSFFSQTTTTTELKQGLSESREITSTFFLDPGNYIIVPYRKHHDQESDLKLRVFQKGAELPGDGSRKLTSMNMPKTVPKTYQDDSYEDIFARYANQSSELEVSQLQRLLNEVVLNDQSIIVEGGGFSLDACRGILLLMDISVNGRLNLEEFRHLWKRLNICKNLFREYDGNRSGLLDFSGLRDSVQRAGFSVSKEMLNLMALRYGDHGRLNFPNFVCCMIRLQTVIKVFQNLTKDGQGVYLSKEEWLQIIMSS